jgi:ketosteroid isomerase-like protein
MSLDLLRVFWADENARRYRRLADLMTDDVILCDPMYGRLAGKLTVSAALERVENEMASSPSRIEVHDLAADDVCGWARWTVHLTGEPSETQSVRGQSLYRFRGNRISFSADYLDTRAFDRARAGKARAADVTSASGAGVGWGDPNGPAEDLIRRFWAQQDTRSYAPLAELFTDDAVFEDIVFGRFDGIDAIRSYLERMDREMPTGGITFTLVDVAAGTTCAWSQWDCHVPGGTLAGWTHHRLRAGRRLAAASSVASPPTSP